MAKARSKNSREIRNRVALHRGVRLRRLAAIAKIVRSTMGWINGWSATEEAEQESAMTAAKRIHAMTAKWKQPNEKLRDAAQ